MVKLVFFCERIASNELNTGDPVILLWMRRVRDKVVQSGGEDRTISQSYVLHDDCVAPKGCTSVGK